MDDDLRTAEHAAFQQGPFEGLSLLAARTEDLTGGDLHARWLRGVCLGALGRYGEAFDVLGAAVRTGLNGLSGLSGVAGSTGNRPDHWASLASSTLGSLHRQLNRHEPALEHDVRALELAPDGDAEALVEARLGLAADAVGLGEVDEAAGQVELARQALRSVPVTPMTGPGVGWRVRVRADWVTAEVALLAGRPGLALKPSATATAQAERSRAPRHVAKSLLFRCVARLLTGSPQEALVDGSRAFDLAVELGVLPLVWPAAMLLTDPQHQLADMLAASRRGEVLEQGAYAVHGIGASLPRDLAVAWRSGPDVHGLLERAGAAPPRTV